MLRVATINNGKKENKTGIYLKGNSLYYKEDNEYHILEDSKNWTTIDNYTDILRQLYIYPSWNLKFTDFDMCRKEKKRIEQQKSEKRSMLKIRKNSESITIDLITIDNNRKKIKYSGFYITKKEIRLLLKLKNLVVKDIHNFCDMSVNEEKSLLNLNFFFCNKDCQHNIKGINKFISIDLNTFKNWFYRNFEKKIKILDVIEKPITKIEINSTKNLKAALTDKHIKRDLIKKIMQLKNYYDTKVIIYDDWVQKSFSYCRYHKDIFTGNGGIILHTDSKNKQYYGIHT